MLEGDAMEIEKNRARQGNQVGGRVDLLISVGVLVCGLVGNMTKQRTEF